MPSVFEGLFKYRTKLSTQCGLPHILLMCSRIDVFMAAGNISVSKLSAPDSSVMKSTLYRVEVDYI